MNFFLFSIVLRILQLLITLEPLVRFRSNFQQIVPHQLSNSTINRKLKMSHIRLQIDFTRPHHIMFWCIINATVLWDEMGDFFSWSIVYFGRWKHLTFDCCNCTMTLSLNLTECFFPHSRLSFFFGWEYNLLGGENTKHFHAVITHRLRAITTGNSATQNQQTNQQCLTPALNIKHFPPIWGNW